MFISLRSGGRQCKVRVMKWSVLLRAVDGLVPESPSYGRRVRGALLKFLKFFCIFECFVFAPCVCSAREGQKKASVVVPEVGVTGVCEPPWCAENWTTVLWKSSQGS